MKFDFCIHVSFTILFSLGYNKLKKTMHFTIRDSKIIAFNFDNELLLLQYIDNHNVMHKTNKTLRIIYYIRYRKIFTSIEFNSLQPRFGCSLVPWTRWELQNWTFEVKLCSTWRFNFWVFSCWHFVAEFGFRRRRLG